MAARNFITEYTKKYDKNNHSLYRINNIRFTGNFMKKDNKDNMLLSDRGHFSNSIFGEEPKLLSFNNSKIQSIKTEKEKNSISSKKRRNISNKH